MSKKMTPIEDNKPLSQSKLWTAQRDFYHQKGAHAWDHEVPFYITSNPFIASRYAQLAIRFIQDSLRLNPEGKSHPFYILELGAGTGQFSYYVLQKIIDLKNKLKLSDLQIQYVMSDFTEKNISFWRRQAQLKPYLQEKLLYFSIYDLEKDKDVYLKGKVKRLMGPTVNPLIIFANYIFDTVKNDVFSIHDGEIKESTVTVMEKNHKKSKNNSLDLKNIKLSFTDRSMDINYYEDQSFNEVLDYYRRTLKNTKLLFPIDSLRAIKNLIRMSNNRCLLISSDKGFAALEELEELDYPKIDTHGSFSWMVNYDAISEYLKNFGANNFIQTAREGIATMVYAIGLKFEHMTETQLALQETVDGFSPADYFTFSEHVLKTMKNASLHTLLSFLRLSDWDPFIFTQIHSRLMQKLQDTDEETVRYLVHSSARLAKHFYATPECEDIFFLLGLLLYHIDKFQEALTYYRASEKSFGTNFETTYNIGLCYFYKKEYKRAAQYFKKALHKKPGSKSTQAILKRTERKIKAISR